MKFQITRTSSRKGPPVPEAKLESYTRIDERVVDDPTKDRYIGKSWYDHGTNHRVENGHIKRDFIDQAYFIELELEQLPAFVAEHGEIVIGPNWDNPLVLNLEIYDDYRE